jgi:hypothetical protein
MSYDPNQQPPYYGASLPPYGAAPPPPGYAPQSQGQYSAPPPQYAPPPQAQAGSDSIAFGEVAWTAGLPVGQFIVRIDDIRAENSQAGNAMLVFEGQTTTASAGLAAGRPAIWRYPLVEKAIGRLGRDMIALQLDGNKRYPGTKNPHGLAQALLAELRGVVIVLDSTEQKDDPTRTNQAIRARYQQTNGTVQQVPPSAPPQAAYPPQSVPQMSVQGAAPVVPPGPPPSPSGPPPGSAFGKV